MNKSLQIPILSPPPPPSQQSVLCAIRMSSTYDPLAAIERYTIYFNPLTAKLFNLNFHPLEAVSR